MTIPGHRPRVVRLWPMLVAAILYICFFSGLDALGLVGPDEPRYAAVAREMVESGDWITPRLYGRPWFEKPVLYYWGAALAFRMFGVNEFAARLPSALGAVFTAAILAWIAGRLYGRTTAFVVLFLLPTSVGMLGFARAATPDMLFTAGLTAAMAAACATLGIQTSQVSEQSATPSRLAAVGFGFALGAATLAKGPAAIVLVGGSLVLWALGSRRARLGVRLAHPVMVVAFCITALPWYALCAARNTEFARTFLLAHNIERYLTPVFRHEQPLWFFGPILLLGLLPWTVLLAGLVRDAAQTVKEKCWRQSPGFFVACWVICPVLFFSFSKSKLPGYVLPAVPPLVLLLARSAARMMEEQSRFVRLCLAGLGATYVLVAATAGQWLRRLPAQADSEPVWPLPWMGAAMVGGLAITLLGLLRRPVGALIGTAALAAALVAGITYLVLPRLDTQLSPRSVARAGQLRAVPGEQIWVYRLPRAWNYGLNFYWHRELPEWNPLSQQQGWLYIARREVEKLKEQDVPLAVVEGSSARAWLVHVSSSHRNAR